MVRLGFATPCNDGVQPADAPQAQVQRQAKARACSITALDLAVQSGRLGSDMRMPDVRRFTSYDCVSLDSAGRVQLSSQLRWLDPDR